MILLLLVCPCGEDILFCEAVRKSAGEFAVCIKVVVRACHGSLQLNRLKALPKSVAWARELSNTRSCQSKRILYNMNLDLLKSQKK